MSKSVYNIDDAIKAYEECGKNLHGAAKRLHTSHITLGKFLRDNGVMTQNVGKSVDVSEDALFDAISDYSYGGLTMEETSEKYHIPIKKLRKLFKENDVNISKWKNHEKKERIVREIKVEKPVRKCHYCDWTTHDISGAGYAMLTHLKICHKDIDIREHVKIYPEDYPEMEKEIMRQNEMIQCKVCGKWVRIIDNRHLLKHGLNKAEYMQMFSDSEVISDGTMQKLHDNISLMYGNHGWERRKSKYEQEIADFLTDNHVDFIMNDRSVLDGMELDFLIGDKAIEFNGNMRHTEGFGGKNKYYHISKTENCREKGIQLIQIFEDEFVLHRDIVFSKIKKFLNISNDDMKIDARKCMIKIPTRNDVENFLEYNHIQGGCQYTIAYGAYYDTLLVGVMTFILEGDGTWNLNRFATLNGTNCRGVGGKLFSHFVRENNPEIVKSFADRRWTVNSDDNLYTKLGFVLDKVISPDYRYFNPHVDKVNRFHKFGFRKDVLSRKYGLDINLSESEMAKQLGYDRIWDCGLWRYIWKK